jgi:acetylornithine deacetylase/succinyl-diaminopimelate desuccinylase-like protein
VSAAFDYASDHLSESVEDLLELLRIPSISALPQHGADTRRAADYMALALERAGMENARAVADPDGGYPVIRGDWLGAPGAPTLLLYGHYDVQPPDPLDEWQSPPFEPAIREGRIYARGADDNKGQIMAIVKGVEAVMRSARGLPVNVKFAIEGEEESGGQALPRYLRVNAAEMAGEAVLVADSQWPSSAAPGLVTVLRGLVYTEVEAVGPAQDLHSGTYGGIASNPFNALAWVIAGLKGPDGRVLIPGFYDDVRDPSPQELTDWSKLAIDDAALLRDEIGSREFFGDPGLPIAWRRWARPTLDVHGIRGGFTGEGAKTVIPARALAKISMRLVPDQDPRKVFDAFVARVQQLASPGVELKVRAINIDPPVHSPAGGRGVTAAARALKRGFGVEPVLTRMGGSVPVTVAFQEALGVELVVTGFGLPDARLHSPNENFAVRQYEGGIKTTIAMLEEFAAG